MKRLYLIDDGYIWEDGQLNHMWWAQEVTDSYEYGYQTPLFGSKDELIEYLRENGGSFKSVGPDEDVDH